MPKVASGIKKDQLEKSKKSSSWNSQLLFPSDSADSIPGIGFKDKTKAKETIKILEGKDVIYQYNVINTMYNRAKVILKRTKNEEKVTNLTEAIRIFEEWVNDYKNNGRHKENFNYLPLDVLSSYQKLAKHYKIADNGFYQIYKSVGGDYKKLRNKVVDGMDLTWDVHRNKILKNLVEKLKNSFETENYLNGLPTKIHTELIMWAYSPEPSAVKKCMSLIDEKI